MAMLTLVVVVLVLAVNARSPFISSKRNPTFGLMPRGGAKKATASPPSTDAEYTAVGVIPSSFLDDIAILSLPYALQPAFQHQDACSLVILKDNSPTALTTLKRDTDMIETLSMTCHVLVLFISNPEISLNPEIVQSILEGARRRRRLAGHDKLKLLVVLAGSSNTSDETREALALNELQDVAPQDFDAFEMTTVEGLSKVWDEMAVHSHDDTSELIDEDGLAKLIETIYESLSKQKCNVKLKAWKDRKDYTDIIQTIMNEVQPKIDELESRQEDIWLNEDRVPMLEFGAEATAILQQSSDTLDAYEPPLNKDIRTDILMIIAAKLKVLYDQQLLALREHYGRRYENVLDTAENKEEWTLEAQRVTEAFRTAGLNSIPKQCQEGQELVDADFGYVVALQGLIADMMEATSSRDGLEPYEDEVDDEPAPRVAKWYEKLAARAAVLGINYLQGWMAYQAIQRAAAERDKNMPKFPLF